MALVLLDWCFCSGSEKVNLCIDYKSEVSVSLRLPAFLELRPTGFQNQTLWGLIFLVQVPRVWVTDVWLERLSLQEKPSHLWYSSHLWLTVLGLWVLTILLLCPSHLFQCGFFLMIFFVVVLFCYSRLFSVLCVVAVLVCPWEEVSSESFYFTISVPPKFFFI